MGINWTFIRIMCDMLVAVMTLFMQQYNSNTRAYAYKIFQNRVLLSRLSWEGDIVHGEQP